ncbi:MAG: flagellar export chaperone FliS [Gudongella sp.]|jgi:flagellar protein FliS|nr:flagellar export chaperone FliS [Gudongella sp.]
MTYANAYSEYKNNEIMSASKNKLVLMLYDGAIKFLKLSEIAIRENRIEKANLNITKAQDIISEFMATLNFDEGGVIADNLYQLYEYMHHTLVRANIEKDVSKVTEVRGYLEELRETWAQL